MKYLWLVGLPLVAFFAIWAYQEGEPEVLDLLEEEPPPMLYYRVPCLQCKQVESGRIQETKAFLAAFKLPYVCGQRHGSSVPVGINERPWQSYVATDERDRSKIIRRMSELGIETRIDQPEEDN